MKRDYMIRYRKDHGLTTQEMAKKCKISKTLLEWLESSEDEVTHPIIAARVAKAYKLTRKQKEGLMPEHYRKSSPNYDQDKYRRDELEYKDFAVTTGWKPAKFM